VVDETQEAGQERPTMPHLSGVFTLFINNVPSEFKTIPCNIPIFPKHTLANNLNQKNLQKNPPITCHVLQNADCRRTFQVFSSISI